MEIHTPTPQRKQRWLMSPDPVVFTPMPPFCSSMPTLFPPTPGTVQALGAMTPRVIGQTTTTFRSPTPPTPLTPRASLKLLSLLNLVAMSPPPPPPPNHGDVVPDSGAK